MAFFFRNIISYYDSFYKEIYQKSLWWVIRKGYFIWEIFNSLLDLQVQGEQMGSEAARGVRWDAVVPFGHGHGARHCDRFTRRLWGFSLCNRDDICVRCKSLFSSLLPFSSFVYIANYPYSAPVLDYATSNGTLSSPPKGLCKVKWLECMINSQRIAFAL